MPFPPPALYLEVDTFDARERLVELADWLDEMVHQLIEPPVRHALLQGRGVHQVAETEWSADARVLDRALQAERRDGEIVREDWTDEAWTQARRDLARGKLKELRHEVLFLGEDGYPDAQRGLAFANVTLTEDEDTACVLAVLVSRAIYGTEIGRDEQAAWAAALCATAARFHAATGYLTIDYVGRESPHEQSIGAYWLDGLRECRSTLRGYHWGNVLSRDHIEMLGGIEQIKREAPCESVAELEEGLCYLQLSGDVDHFSDEALVNLETYLRPLLQQPDDDFEYVGLPLRVV